VPDSESRPSNQTAFAALRRFARERAVAERCEVCSAPLAPDHQHLIEPPSRRLLCCCDACALLFSSQHAARYRRVPRRVRALPDFRLSDAQWERLLIPIDLAFFSHSSQTGKVAALYPSPAGATESLLELEAWDDLVRDNPVLKELQPDVEALLVNRVGGAREYYLAPIDRCYELVGLIRTHWRGLSGGERLWVEVGRFFARLKEQG
jgi:hypothetical protein